MTIPVRTSFARIVLKLKVGFGTLMFYYYMDVSNSRSRDIHAKGKSEDVLKKILKSNFKDDSTKKTCRKI